jgi:hypothetical protein
MKATSSEDWRVTISSKSLGTRAWGVFMLALGAMLVIAAGGMVLQNGRDWPLAAFSVVLGGAFGEGGVHLLRRAGKPVFEIDPTGVTYHPLDDSFSWKTVRIPWDRVRSVRWAVPAGMDTYVGKMMYFDYEEAPVRNWFTRAYDLVAGRRPGDPEPLAHAALALRLSSIPEDELFQLLEDLSKRHGFALKWPQ